MKSATNQLVEPRAIRRLAPTEAFFLVGDGVYVGYGVTAEGPIDLAALRRAAARLSDTHPGLRARIVADAPGSGIFVHRDDPTPVGVSESSGTVDAAAPLPDIGLSQGETLAAVHVITESNHSHLVYLMVHHALADGHHGLALLQSLWTAYTAIATGTEDTPAQAPATFPRPLEEILAERGYPAPAGDTSAGVALLESAASLTGSTTPTGDPAAPSIRRARLTAAETAALVAHGHRTGRTVNQMVSAAFIAAAATVRGLGVSQVAYWYPVDLRHRLGKPAIAFTDVTDALGAALFQSEGDETSLDELAAQVGAGLARDLAAGTVQQPTTGATTGPPPEDGVMAVLTNWGPVPHLPTPPGLALTDFHPALHLAASGSTEDTAMWEAAAAAFPLGIASSFRGRLSVDLWGTAIPDTLVPEILRNLRSFTTDAE